MTIGEKAYKFSKLEGEPLKEFWQNHGGHYNFCIQHKMRAAKKASKARNQEKKETVKRAKTSYEIAGVYYLDINKVKSKSRAILNLKQDGDKLEGNDEAFVKEIISCQKTPPTITIKKLTMKITRLLKFLKGSYHKKNSITQNLIFG